MCCRCNECLSIAFVIASELWTDDEYRPRAAMPSACETSIRSLCNSNRILQIHIDMKTFGASASWMGDFSSTWVLGPNLAPEAEPRLVCIHIFASSLRKYGHNSPFIVVLDFRKSSLLGVCLFAVSSSPSLNDSTITSTNMGCCSPVPYTHLRLGT